jgi:putative FmdB family regulatory protein
MPTYEYACKSCGEHLEVVQSFRDEPLTACPACGGNLRKVFGSIGISFKGSGFYKTDSRSSSGSGAKKESEGAPAASTSGGDGGSSSSSDSGSSGSATSSSSSSTPSKAAAS